MRELKPCPFCGGEARVNTLKWLDGYTATALCKNEPNAHYLNTWDEDEAQAVERITEAWNTRAERTCEQEERGWGTEGDHARVWLTCGHDCMVPTVQDLPNYCPQCGARVIEEE